MRAGFEDNFGNVLFACAHLLDTLAQAEVNRQAGRVVARPALMRLLPFLEREGIRPSELARRADVSKQAISQSLALLEAQKLVEYVPDPDDGRATKVRLTRHGGAAIAHGMSVLAHFERALAERLGRKEVDRTLRSLQRIQRVLAEWDERGAPPPTRG
jgi:DNA-binding MarR family transcriptional regulator